jgi:hypothetical protein
VRRRHVRAAVKLGATIEGIMEGLRLGVVGEHSIDGGCGVSL